MQRRGTRLENLFSLGNTLDHGLLSIKRRLARASLQFDSELVLLARQGVTGVSRAGLSIGSADHPTNNP